ncbi:MAG: helix-turn-helix transcriptional regulator [Fimbriimonadaceae bacterium]|nr:helix-turn-helix transcriptional regulator [Fimbriimonadaceae bacterium]
MAVAEVFRALGDPVRLEIVRRLSQDTPYTISNLTEDLGVTRQGARKHLQVLENSRLIILRPEGRQVRVSLDAETLKKAKSFIAELEAKWDARLEALRQFVEED